MCEGWKDRQKERQTKRERERVWEDWQRNVCFYCRSWHVHGLSISIALSLSLLFSVETVNTDASECLHKQTLESCSNTHTHTQRDRAGDRHGKLRLEQSQDP